MSRQGILHTGKTMVGEEVPVREWCLMLGLALALGVLGWGSRWIWNRTVFLTLKMGLGLKPLMVHRRVLARRKGTRLLRRWLEVVAGARCLFPGGGVDSGTHSPTPKGYSSSHSPTELERAQQLANCLKIKPGLRRKIRRKRNWFARQGWRCLRRRMICPSLSKS